MKKTLFLLISILLISACTQSPTTYNTQIPTHLIPALLDGTSRNPIITHIYTADPTARVFDGRIYVYASHDLDDQRNYDMIDYHIFSSDDMVNWQDHGIGLHVDDIRWADKLYAPDCVYNEKTGKYYLFFPNGGSNIGVAVSDNPAGPFTDELKRPLITRNYGNSAVPWLFDPNVLIDDDGQAYLYFGGGMPGTGDNARVIRLNEDFTGFVDSAATTIVAPDFFEAAFTYKRNDKYYFTYSTNWENDHAIRIDYLMSDNPMTDFEYRGTVIDNPPGNQGNNNHHSIVDYQGNTYIFYHNRKLALSRGDHDGYQRSITFDRLSFDENGLITPTKFTNGTEEQLKNVDAFSTIEAELMAAQDGIKVSNIIENEEKTGATLSQIDDGDWTAVSQVDFETGAEQFHARVFSREEGGSIELWIDGGKNNGGTRIGVCKVPASGNWADISTSVDEISGVHDLYLIYKGRKLKEDMFLLDSYRFE